MWTIILVVATLSLVPLATSRCDTCNILKQPSDTTAYVGERARLNCSVNVEAGKTVYWKYNNTYIWPWPTTAYTDSGFSFPQDAHTGLDQYDLVIDRVSLGHHHRAQFYCGVHKESMESRRATITVRAPPNLLMSPHPVGGLITVDPLKTEIQITCSTNFADPQFEIEWIIDGVKTPGVDNTRYRLRPGGGRLLRVNSATTLKLWPYGVSDELMSFIDISDSQFRLANERKYYERRYLNVYRVSCRIVNSDVKPKREEQSAWVVFKEKVLPSRSHVSHLNATFYGLAGTALMLVLILGLGILIYRRYPQRCMKCIKRRGCKDRNKSRVSNDVKPASRVKSVNIVPDNHTPDGCSLNETDVSNLNSFSCHTTRRIHPSDSQRWYHSGAIPFTRMEINKPQRRPVTVRSLKRYATVNAHNYQRNLFKTALEKNRYCDKVPQIQNHSSLRRSYSHYNVMPVYSTWNLHSNLPRHEKSCMHLPSMTLPKETDGNGYGCNDVLESDV